MKERPILFQGAMVRALLAGTKTQTRRAITFTEQQQRWLQDPTLYLQRMYGTSPPPNPVDFGTRGLWRIVGPDYPDGKDDDVRCPYGAPGDRLWVREAWKWHGGRMDCTRPRTADHRSLFDELYVSFVADGARVTLKPNGEDWPVPKAPPQREGEVYSLRDAPEDFHYTGENTYTDRLQRWWNRTIPPIHMYRWACRLVLEVTAVRVERLQEISRGDAMDEGCPFPNMAQGDDPRQWYATLWDSINGAGSWAANPWVWVLEFRKT